MSMLSNLELLRRVPLFSALTPSQSASIADAIVKKRFKRSEVIVEQGKKSDALYIILTGRARVMSTDNRGREVILATLNQGDYLGEMSLIDDEPHSATVRTEIQTDVLVLAREAFGRCLPETHRCRTTSCEDWCSACVRRIARSNRWRSWTSMVASPAR